MKSIAVFLLCASQVFAQGDINGRREVRPAAGVLGPQVPQQPISFDCAVDGTVVNSVTGEPIARARVTLSSGGSNAAATTDGSGKWSLSNAGCGVSQVVVTRPGFLRIPSAPGGNTVNLSRAAGVHDLKIQLTPQAVVFGKVVDDQGDPLMSIQIMALFARVVQGRLQFQPTGGGATNDLGEYRVASLARGKYIFCARTNQQTALVAGGAETMTAESCYPGPPDAGAAAAIDLPAGRETRIDFTLRQVPAVHVRGTVSGLPPGRGMSISLARRQGSGVIEPGASVPGAVREGRFDIRVTPGSYTLMADYFESGKRLTARVPVNVGGSDIDNVAVNLESGFTVTGVVRIESSSTAATSTSATNFKPFALNLRPSEPANASGQLKWEADRASFAFHEMLPGSYRLDITPPPPFYLKSATLAGQDIIHREVVLSQAAGPIEIVLREDGGSIEGDIAGGSGEVVPGGVMVMKDGHLAGNLISQSSGHFRIANLAPGDYVAYAWDDVNAVEYANPDWMSRYAAAGVPVTVSPGQISQVKLTRQTAPSGTP